MLGKWMVLVGAGLLGFLLPVVPFWLDVGDDMLPAGPGCGFEDDPGSGWSRVGVEIVDWGFAPERACVPIEPQRLEPPFSTMSIPYSGPSFEQAATQAKRRARTEGWDATEFALDGNRSGPLYTELLPWPVVSGAGAATLCVFVLLVIGMPRTPDTLRGPKRGAR